VKGVSNGWRELMDQMDDSKRQQFREGDPKSC
jgi:hypothetical protein